MSDYYFGVNSEKQLATIRPFLNKVFRKTLSLGIIDFAVTEGRRLKERQDALNLLNPPVTKVEWPNSKHNVNKPDDELTPDDLVGAGDVVPYINGLPSYNPLICCFLAGLIMTVAKEMLDNGEEGAVPIRWGGNWDRDGEPITDQKFQDLVHFEEVIL